MMDKLPKDLPGGWKFDNSFTPEPLSTGQVWRKCGPIDAIKIIRVMMPGHSEYDGGAQGISVIHTTVKRCKVVWERQSWFKGGSEAQLLNWLNESGYAPAFE